MLRYALKVSPAEKALIEATRALRYGELFEVAVAAGEPTEAIEVSPGEADLLRLVRSAGPLSIDVLTVHQGQPVLAELELIVNGFRGRKKLKLPVQDE